MPDEIIEHPTYLRHIRYFFEDMDILHMSWHGLDLSTYESVKQSAVDIYFKTKPPNAFMPPEPERKWSVERSTTFQNWIRDEYPLGEPIPQLPQTRGVSRIRKDLRDLSGAELDKLALAFRGMMDRESSDLQSYFVLGGIHWWPEPTFCIHREDRYNPWHRMYLRKFEDAMRTVPGCEDVTLPYWDITTPPPDFLFEPPFASYTLPEQVHPSYPAGYTTSRYSAQDITDLVQLSDVPAQIADALATPIWNVAPNGAEGFNEKIITAHNSGHVACGGDMQSSDLTSFDPIFWFFHSNWERLWWEWQQIMSATTLTTFRTTITGSPLFLEPGFNKLNDFPETADQTIDLSAFDIGYADPPMPRETPVVGRAAGGSFVTGRGLRISRAPMVSVRVKGINRLAIPGSFRIALKAGGEPIAQRGFFQSTEPTGCPSCRKKELVNIDMLVEADRVIGRDLKVDVEVLDRKDPRKSGRVPPYVCGNPTLNVRLLLEEST